MYGLTEDEVEAMVWYPMRRVLSATEVEHYGYADDGREFKVVTDRSETYVVTITEEQRRRKFRREKAMRRKLRRRYR
jgi:arginyl-tRNA--protein-N-Asp/Glu arginylyltransferase